MAVFMLNTDSVTSASETLNTISNDIKEAINSVNSYETSNEDSFDFETAKSTISSNIEACATKVLNTMNVLKSVVSTHTNLQNGIKFESEDAGSTNPTDQNPGASEQGNGYGNNQGNYNGQGSYNDTGGYGGSGGYGGTTEPEDLFSDPLFTSLIASGLFAIIKEEDLENTIKEKTTLVIKANKKDKKAAEYITMLTKIAVANKIPVTFIESNDEESTISLVKNGETLKTYKGYQTKETIEKMFEEYKDKLSDSAETESGSNSNNETESDSGSSSDSKTDTNNTDASEEIVGTTTNTTIARKSQSLLDQLASDSTSTDSRVSNNKYNM